MTSSQTLNFVAGYFDGTEAGKIAHPTFTRPSADSNDRASVEPSIQPRAAYASRRVDPVAALTAVLVATATLASLQCLDVLPFHKHEQRLAVLNVLDLSPPPPPKAPPEALKEAKPHVQSPIVVPPPIVALVAPPPMIAVADSPAPSEPAPVTRKPAADAITPAPAPVSVAPADGGDLSSKMVAATPPTYPEASRRLREQGTVVLDVLLAMDGRVERVSVARSSGFYRLDRAACGAVRHWRWSPTVRNGQAVNVQGNVVIPFILRA